MKLRLYEIFTSIEGEGILCGTKTLFVRLAGCPFTCFYCDTAGALPADSGTEYEMDEACSMIQREIKPHTYKVNFTGGEPLLQHEAVAEMARFVQSLKLRTYIESSCYDAGRFSHVLPYIDIAKIEFKTSDSEFVDPEKHENLVQNAFACLRESAASGKVTYVKLVVSARTGADEIESLAQKIRDCTPAGRLSGVVIQPTTGIEEPTLEHLIALHDSASRHLKDVRIVPQLHKMLGAP